jgi:hypothetical protein
MPLSSVAMAASNAAITSPMRAPPLVVPVRDRADRLPFQGAAGVDGQTEPSAGAHDGAQGAISARECRLGRDRDAQPAPGERSLAPALFIGEQFARPGQYSDCVTEALTAAG